MKNCNNITGNFANATGDYRINFKVADGKDGKDAVNLNQLNSVKTLCFNYIGPNEPQGVKGDIWLDTSNNSIGIVKVKVITPEGSKWVSKIDLVEKGLIEKLQKLEDKVIAVFNNTDGRYALKNGSPHNRFMISDAISNNEATTLRQLKTISNDIENKLNDINSIKANKNDFYSKSQILAMIEHLVPRDSIIGPFNIVSAVTNVELDTIEALSGDVYYITDENTWAVKLDNQWLKIDNLLIDKNFTKQQILELMSTKANIEDIDLINKQIEEIKNIIVDGNLHVSRMSGISIVTTEGGSVFAKPLKYSDSIVIPDDADDKTLVDKQYVDKKLGIIPNPPEIIPPNIDNVYTKEEIDEKLKDYALKEGTLTKEYLDTILTDLFRNRNDVNWKGYKASLQEIVSILNPEVGDIYGVITLDTYPDIYMFDGDRWISFVSTKSGMSIGNAIKVIDSPAVTVSDDLNIGLRMCIVPIGIGNKLQIVGVYKENTGKLISIPFVSAINDNTANVYTNSETIDRIVYVEGSDIEVDLPTDNLFKLNEDNIVIGNTTFEGNVIINKPTEPNQPANKGYVDEQITEVKNTITNSNYELVEQTSIVLEESDAHDKGSKMFKIPLEPNIYVHILDAYKEDVLNNSIDRVNIDVSIKNDTLFIYTDSNINKLVYIKYGKNK